ncbi:Protein GrpE [Candidatus Xenohaliotis californiensis]|uniref:Protein GrpE n=1 Tax=Candidatus Xenohaliotis californiensis TaxID=84677 RepID=A0ABM9N8N3_9RICK|nr:Protein GrpE [Candidatus Xenohaliotis californiensis]
MMTIEDNKNNNPIAGKAKESNSTEKDQEENGRKSIEDDKEKITKLMQTIDDYKNRWLRAAAENENIRKRFTKELKDSREYAVSEIAKDVAELKENFHLAKTSISQELLQDKHIEAIYRGIEMIDKLFNEMLKKHGVKPINPIGKAFDHNYHQAIHHKPSTEHAPGTVIEVIKSGYMIKDRLLIPALVSVAKEPEEKPTATN